MKNLERCTTDRQWQCEACRALVPKRFATCECGQFSDLPVMHRDYCFHPNLSGRIKRDEVEKLAKAKLKFLHMSVKHASPNRTTPERSAHDEGESCSAGFVSTWTKLTTDSTSPRGSFESTSKRKRCPATKWWVVGEPCLHPDSETQIKALQSSGVVEQEEKGPDAEAMHVETAERSEERHPLEDTDTEQEQIMVRQTRRRVFAPANAAEVDVPQTPTPSHAVIESKTRSSKRTRRTPAALRGFSLEKLSKKKTCLQECNSLTAEELALEVSSREESGGVLHLPREEKQTRASVESDLDEHTPSLSQAESAKEGCGTDGLLESECEAGIKKPGMMAAKELPIGEQALPSHRDEGSVPTQELPRMALKASATLESKPLGNPPSPEEAHTISPTAGSTPPTPDDRVKSTRPEACISSFHCPEKLNMHEFLALVEPAELCSAEYNRGPLSKARANGHCKPMRALAPLFSNAKGNEVADAGPDERELLAAEATISNLLNCVDMAASPPPLGAARTNAGAEEEDPQGVHRHENKVPLAVGHLTKDPHEETVYTPTEKSCDDLNMSSPQDPFEVPSKTQLASARRSRGARLAGLASEQGAGSNSTDGKQPDSPGSNTALRVTLKIPKQTYHDHINFTAGGVNVYPSTPLSSPPLGSVSQLSSPTSPPTRANVQIAPGEFATPAAEKFPKAAPRGILKPSSPPGGGGHPELEPPTPPLLEDLVSEFAAIRDILQKQPELSNKEEFKEIIERLNTAQVKAKLDSATKKARKSVTFAEGEALKAVRLI